MKIFPLTLWMEKISLQLMEIKLKTAFQLKRETDSYLFSFLFKLINLIETIEKYKKDPKTIMYAEAL